MNNGKLFVISGPSGVGKDTVVKTVLEKMPEAFLSVSLTTRPPRGQEREGVDYFYTDNASFEAEISAGRMLEYCRYVDVYYGTPLLPVEKAVSEGKPVLLVIESDGMKRVCAARPDTVTVFIAPPSFEELKSRLVGRGTESAEQVEKRLKKAEWELAHKDDYRYIVTNRVVEECADEIIEIIKNHLHS